MAEEAYPSGVGFLGFTKSVSVAPNDVLCHGVPDTRPIQGGWLIVDGDYVNLDLTCFKNGFFGDNSVMVTRGEIPTEVAKLVIS